MLIQRAELTDGRVADLRIAGGRIVDLGERLAPKVGERVVDAAGGFLCPGLHDHHIHLMAYAASLDSLPCGPPDVMDAAQLSAALDGVANGRGWVRGVGYHDSVAGPIDGRWLDARIPNRPVRIQHRSGRLWIVNSAGLAALGGTGPAEIVDGEPTGRFYDADAWMKERLGSTPPDLARASRVLASHGVTGLTDATPRNGPEEAELFETARREGLLQQKVHLMGAQGIAGPRKLHFHDYDLPPLDETTEMIARSHAEGRTVAAHCVTRTELAYILAALGDAGALAGDRIEHCGVCPPEFRTEIARLGLTVVTQPNFIFEKGDAYLAEVEADDQPWLYPAASLIGAGIALAAGSDAPFGGPDPWAAMSAAVTRRTRGGATLLAEERVTPERALAFFTTPPDDPGGASRQVAVGEAADLCLTDRPWRSARQAPGETRVRMTVADGQIIWEA